jgi:hypothetical protein
LEQRRAGRRCRSNPRIADEPILCRGDDIGDRHGRCRIRAIELAHLSQHPIDPVRLCIRRLAALAKFGFPDQEPLEVHTSPALLGLVDVLARSPDEGRSGEARAVGL